jgi:serine/threonine protein kinase
VLLSSFIQVDNWALGVCIYQWTFGQLPFSGSNTSEVFDSICKQPLALPPEVAISDALANLITSASPNCASLNLYHHGDAFAVMAICHMHARDSSSNPHQCAPPGSGEESCGSALACCCDAASLDYTWLAIGTATAPAQPGVFSSVHPLEAAPPSVNQHTYHTASPGL